MRNMNYAQKHVQKGLTAMAVLNHIAHAWSDNV